jgi:hypothetical protein
MIRAGLVELDGEVIGKAGAKLKIPETACPIVDGVAFPPAPLLVAYHKPVSCAAQPGYTPDRSYASPEPPACRRLACTRP